MGLGLEGLVPWGLYLTAIAAVLLSVFWRPIVGIFYLLPLIPLQTVRYRLNEFPLGESVVGVILLAVVLGLLRRHQSVLPKTPWTKLLCIYVGYTFLSLWLGAFFLGSGLPLPGDPRFGVWQDYMVMPAMLLLIAAIEPSKRQTQALILVLCLGGLLLSKGFWGTASGRDFSSFSNDLRDEGAMGYAGSNELAAFEAQFAIFALALAAFEKKRLRKLAYYALGAFSALCLMYSLSRGGYVAFLAGWVFLGLTKQRVLLVALIVFALTWTTVVPNAVQQRVFMTYDENGALEHSAETRITLWEDAMELFDSNPATGTGFNTYAYMHRVGTYEDTHNFFLKVMVETGLIGLALFIWLIAKTFLTGFRLFRRAKDPFYASLGLGLAAWLLCAAVANCFGDRWGFLQVNGYMWAIGGLVAHAWKVEQGGVSEGEDERGAEAEAQQVVEAV
jgi:O-antigen ligase